MMMDKKLNENCFDVHEMYVVSGEELEKLRKDGIIVKASLLKTKPKSMMSRDGKNTDFQYVHASFGF